MFRFAATIAFLSAVPVVFLAGCERQVAVDNSNVDVVNRRQEQARKRTSRDSVAEEGLTPKEVESVLGLPNKPPVEGKRVLDYRREVSFTTWTYEREGQAIELSFIDGKLQGTVPKFGEKLNPEAPRHMKNKAPAGEAEAK